jgi:hypothetical protein
MKKNIIENTLLPTTGPYSPTQGDSFNIRIGKSLQVLNIVVLLFAIVIVVLRSLADGAFPPHNVSTLYLTPFFIASVCIFKFKGLFKTSVWILTFTGYIAITLRLLDAGGLSSANVILYTLFPLTSYVFLHDKVYIFQTITCILTLVGFYTFMPYGINGVDASEGPLIKMALTILSLVIAIIMIWFNEKFSEEYHKKAKKLEKQNIGIKIVSALNHELINPLNFLKTGFKIAREQNDHQLFDKCERSIIQLEERILRLNKIVNEYELSGDETLDLESIETIKEDLERN